ncbi:MAG: DEAD/DEAH box helicase, partial [Bacteroidota bacterium]|nr:DEAD/DEAH box helicase [Bacteroidota bacterium]
DVLYEPENPLPDFSFDMLEEDLRERVTALGWTTPTPVQRKAIPYLLEGRDMIVQARTGSGKTGAYLLPIIQTIDTSKKYCQALILAPTRELAKQVSVVLEQLTVGTDLLSTVIYGGVRYGGQIKDLKDGAQIVVGTPGRILDHVYKGNLTLMNIHTLVFDEADEMLSMGFYPSMRKLRRQIPEKRKTYMFSATIPYHVEQLAYEFLHNSDRLSLSKGNQSVTELEHRYYIAPSLQKDRSLLRLIEYENPDSALIFTNTKRDAEYLSEFLQNNGIEAEHLTGDLRQSKREKIMDQLRSGELRFVIATDVAARGIDISDLSYVFLYDIPEHVEVYVHRSGRTARAGKTGVAITICESIQERKLLGIARQYGFSIEQRELPTDEMMQERLTERLIVRLEDQLNDYSIMDRDRVARFLPVVGTLYEDEDMRMLLAMLLDGTYRQSLHARLFERQETARKQRSTGSSSGGSSSRGGGSKGGGSRGGSSRGGSRSGGDSDGGDGRSQRKRRPRE